MIYYIGNPKDNYNISKNTTLNDCINYCKNQKVLGLDIETTKKYTNNEYIELNYEGGLDPFLSRIIMLQIGTLENQYIIDTRYVDIKPLKFILETKDILKVGHNLKFECIHLKHNYDFNLKNLHDTMICERILYNGNKLSYSLENVSKRHLNVKVNSNTNINLFNNSSFEIFTSFDDDLEFIEINKNIRSNFVKWGDKPFTEDQIQYGTDDIILPLKLYNIQIQGREVDNEVYLPIKAFNLENKIIPILANMYLRGVYVDTEGWKKLYKKNLTIYNKIKSKLDEYIVKNYPKFTQSPDLFNNKYTCRIDWKSPKQVIEFVNHLGICPKERSKQTGKMEYTVGATAILRILKNNYKEKYFKLEQCDIIDNQSFLLNFLLLKRYQQLTTTFGLDWLKKYIHPITGKVHPNFVQLQNTSRMSSTSPNCQQIPSGAEWRKLFIAPKGYKFVASDFAA